MNPDEARELWVRGEELSDQPIWLVVMDLKGQVRWVRCRRPSTDLRAAVDEAWRVYRAGITPAMERWALGCSHARDEADVRAYNEARARSLDLARVSDPRWDAVPDPQPREGGARKDEGDQDLEKAKARTGGDNEEPASQSEPQQQQPQEDRDDEGPDSPDE